MTHLHINGAKLFVQDSGGPGETILFIHGLMLPSTSWHAQVDRFRATHRVIAYDLRGQGRSEMTPHGLDLDNLAEDAAALIETLSLDRVHVVAFSMGTFIAMRLAARHPALVRSLTLIGPSAEAEERSNLPRYKALIAFVQLFGPGLAAGPLMKILFGNTFLADPASRMTREHWRGVLRGLPKTLSRAAAASAGRQAIRDLLSAITAPTLIVSGTEDRPISPERAARVHHGIAGSRFVPVPATGHAVMIERPDAFNTMLDGFLREVEAG
ncbi:alpha/beta hydrolase [Fertoebacter nigrum]|uniref:Alpha/beta hydrolase n=1 Tax=Fertoeibacter niger TaxID=2656921 RepID=A0A8X8H135_9RHOB|nr:alpha/beta hydrolase [Fertoeibacter niger]NUB45628.1 alpha/beta hydrolase [Fertoeibacter niger]